MINKLEEEHSFDSRKSQWVQGTISVSSFHFLL